MTVTPDVLQDLAPTGVLRAAINFGNSVLAQRDPTTGEPRGVSVDLARELGQRLGVPIELVTFDAAGKVFEALKTGAWDIAFLAVDPARSAEIIFTAPYVIIEGTYMVRANSPLKRVAEVDRAGVRVAAGAGSAYELFLSRTLKSAQLVRRSTGAEAFETFMSEGLEAMGSVRQVLLQFTKTHSGLRVMDDSFMTIEQAMGTPKPREIGARFLSMFIEEHKANGFIAAALQRSGQTDATVAPTIF